MKAFPSFVLAATLIPTASYAGQIYGSFQQGGRVIAQSLPFRIQCVSGFKRDNLATDRYGAYRVSVPDRGQCTLTVRFRNQEADIRIYSYDRPIRYDFELIQSDTQLRLRRK